MVQETNPIVGKDHRLSAKQSPINRQNQSVEVPKISFYTELILSYADS